MRAIASVLMVIAIVLGASTTSAQQAPPRPAGIPADWRQWELAGVSFYTPPDLVDDQVGGIDWYDRRVHGDGFWLEVQLGNLGYNLQRQLPPPRYQTTPLELGGKPATLVTGPANRELTLACHHGHIVYIHIQLAQSLEFDALGCARNAAGLVTLQRIFASVAVTPPPPRPG